MVTGETLTYEPKGVDAFELDNYIRLMMATNDVWAVPASGNARRYCILEVSTCRQGDFEYFEELKFEMENEGPESLLSYLKNYKLNKNLRKLPETPAIIKNKILTAAHSNPILGWWIQRLIDQCQLRGDVGWKEFVPLDRLYRDYFNHKGNISDRGNQTSFGIVFKTLIPPSMVISKKRVDGILKRGYRFPSVRECREFICQQLKEPQLFDQDWGI
jgi:hypothetical protein